MNEHMSPIPSMIYNAAVGGHVTNSQQIVDENLNREQQDINEEVAAIPYNATTPNGMGKIVLKKNDNFKTVVEAQSGNTIFVIKYDFTLTGDVTIPANCVLHFEGGSIANASGNNYTITGNNTQISCNSYSFLNKNVVFAGTWCIEALIPDWVKADNDYDKIQWCLDRGNICQKVKLLNKKYEINQQLVARYNIHLEGSGAVSNFNIDNVGLNGTILKSTATTNAILYITFENNQYSAGGCLIEGIAFYGPGGNGDRCNGINFKPNNAPNRNIVVRDSAFVSLGKGICTDTDSNEMTNCTVELYGLFINWCKYGIYSIQLNYWCGLHIHDCTIEGNSIANIYLYSNDRAVCTQSVIIENNLLESAPIGIKLSAVKANIRIEGNYYEGDVNNHIDGRDMSCYCQIINNYHYSGNAVFELANIEVSIHDSGLFTYKALGSLKVDYSDVLLTPDFSNVSTMSISNGADDYEIMYDDLSNKELYQTGMESLTNTIKCGKGLKIPVGNRPAGEMRIGLSGQINDCVAYFVPYYSPSNTTMSIHTYMRNGGDTILRGFTKVKLNEGFNYFVIYTKAPQNFNSETQGIYVDGSYGVPVIANLGNVETIKIHPKATSFKHVYIPKSQCGSLSADFAGFCAIDDTNKIPVYWNGEKWIKADGTDA